MQTPPRNLHRPQAEVGETAEGVAQSLEALVQLCSLLPAGAAVFGEGPAQEPKRRAAEVDAGRCRRRVSSAGTALGVRKQALPGWGPCPCWLGDVGWGACKHEATLGS